MDKVSILIPVYNVENYIETCLNSIVKQTYKNIEIIIIDDGSTDNSCEVIKKFLNNDDRIKLISRKNIGLFKTRQELIEIADSTYSMFVDPDDWIDVDTVEKLYNTIKKYDCDTVRCNKVKELLEQNRKIYMPRFNAKKGVIYKEDFKNEVYTYFIDDYICNSVVAQLIKTEILKKNKMICKVKMAEDLRYNLELYTYIKSVCFIEDYCYHYRYNVNSITTRISLDIVQGKLDDVLYVYNSLFDYIKKWDMDDSTTRRKIGLRVYREMLICVKQLLRIRNISFRDIYLFIENNFNKNELNKIREMLGIININEKMVRLAYYKKYKQLLRYLKYNVYFKENIKEKIKKIIYKGR